MKPTTGSYSPQLDHLRFFAAMLVFFWHSLHSKGLIAANYAPENIFISWMEEGHTGVSLFMVLSGFLLFQIMEGKKIAIMPFYTSRILRIMPLVIFWAVWLIDLKARTLSDLLLSFIPIGTAIQGKGIDGYWSISVELTFYVLLPVLILELKKYDGKNEFEVGVKKLGLLLLLIFFSMLFRSLATFRGEDAKILSYLSIFGRITEFLMGGIALIIAKYFKPQLKLKVYFFLFCSIAFLLFMNDFNTHGGYYALSNYPDRYRIVWTSMNVISGLFYGSLILLYIDPKFTSFSFFSRVIASGGVISYSIYLNHFFTLNVINSLRNELFGASDLSWLNAFYLYVCVALSLTLAFSTFTYFIVEKPFLRMRQTYIIEDGRSGVDL